MLTTGTQRSRVCSCIFALACVCVLLYVSVITERARVSEGERDKNMKDSLIWINLEHENETDTQTRRGRQGELCWVLRLSAHMNSQTLTLSRVTCHREAWLLQLRHDMAKYKIAQVNKMLKLHQEARLKHNFYFYQSNEINGPKQYA